MFFSLCLTQDTNTSSRLKITGQDTVWCLIADLGEIFRRTTTSAKNSDCVDNALFDGYYPEHFDDVHAYKMHPTNAKDVPGTDMPAHAFLSKI